MRNPRQPDEAPAPPPRPESGRSGVLVLHANLIGNLGDFAILHGTLAALGRLGRPLCIAPYGFPWIDRERADACVRALPPDAVIGPSVPWTPAARFLRWMRRIPALRRRANALAFACALRRMRADARLMETLRSSACAVVSGGGHWRKDDFTVNLLAAVALCGRAGVRCVLLPHSADASLTHQIAPALFRRALAGTPTACRDRASVSVLERMGVGPLEWVPDMAFAIGSRPGAGPRAPQCLLALRDAPERQAPAYRDRFLALLAALRARGLEPVLFTTALCDDAALHARLAGYDAKLTRLAPRTVDEALAVLARARLVMTDRFHGFLLGMLAGTPVVPLVRQPKVAGLARDMAHPLAVPSEEHLDAEALDAVCARLDEVAAVQTRFAVDQAPRIDDFVRRRIGEELLHG